jgi:protein disulfide-isomerase
LVYFPAQHIRMPEKTKHNCGKSEVKMMSSLERLLVSTGVKSAFTWLSLAIILALTAWPARAAELTWLTDLPKAQAQANAEKKSVLLFFHGSDWCPTCRELERDVIKSLEFNAYARQALVLVDVDFPTKDTQSEALKRANAALRQRFNIGDNLPTLVLLNESGETVFQEAGYAGGGPAAVLPNLQRHAKAPGSTGGIAGINGIKDLNVAEFAKLAADKQNVILDVRTADEFKAGHIVGAVNLDFLAADFEKRAAALDKGKTCLVHCATGVRSIRACTKLCRLDFPKLYNLPGGFKAWMKAGQPVEK